jgi:thymidylate synthase (FAD)
LTHELVRHRIASYSQRSQRYVRESTADYITPPELAEFEGAGAVYEQAMDAAWQAYRDLLHSGVKPEIARYVLPNACSTEIICTWNFREIRHIVKLRSGPAALPEMRAVAAAIREIMKAEAPKVFGDL